MQSKLIIATCFNQKMCMFFLLGIHVGFFTGCDLGRVHMTGGTLLS